MSAQELAPGFIKHELVDEGTSRRTWLVDTNSPEAASATVEQFWTRVLGESQYINEFSLDMGLATFFGADEAPDDLTVVAAAASVPEESGPLEQMVRACRQSPVALTSWSKVIIPSFHPYNPGESAREPAPKKLISVGVGSFTGYEGAVGYDGRNAFHVLKAVTAEIPAHFAGAATEGPGSNLQRELWPLINSGEAPQA